MKALSVDVTLAIVLGMAWEPLTQSQAASLAPSLPNPTLFKIPAKQLPWHTDFLLDARVENNRQATEDAAIIYDPTINHSPSWSQLHRVTGWYEDALMEKGKMSPVVEILVSEFRSAAHAYDKSVSCANIQ